MKIVLASHNKGKLAELMPLFAPLGVQLLAQSQLSVPQAPEPYKTFLENALAKARNAAEHTGLPAIADDAGLCIDAWGGLPGVAVLSPLDPQPLIAVGRVQGEITTQEVGEGGFGFDSVMWIAHLGKTMAQLEPTHKNQISHRGQSARQMLHLIRDHWLHPPVRTDRMG
jgi:XTP/dITP diphosphohydrolase